jgi:mRNA interferase RelE/StbE
MLAGNAGSSSHFSKTRTRHQKVRRRIQAGKMLNASRCFIKGGLCCFKRKQQVKEIKMHQILLSRSAGKDNGKIDPKYKPHIFEALFGLRQDPYLGKKLKGKFKQCYSLRVGQYRIIYRVYQPGKTVLVIRIGQRQGAY